MSAARSCKQCQGVAIGLGEQMTHPGTQRKQVVQPMRIGVATPVGRATQLHEGVQQPVRRQGVGAKGLGHGQQVDGRKRQGLDFQVEKGQQRLHPPGTLAADQAPHRGPDALALQQALHAERHLVGDTRVPVLVVVQLIRQQRIQRRQLRRFPLQREVAIPMMLDMVVVLDANRRSCH